MSDLINRQDAIDAISTWDKFGIDERNRIIRWHEGLEPFVKLRDVVWSIEKLPSAERKGKWIEDGCMTVCSLCGERREFPYCGADKRGERIMYKEEAE